MTGATFCYWTVACGADGSDASALVSSARSAGVFTDIHVWTDHEIPLATCHKPGMFKRWGGLYRLTYLRDAVATLPYEYSVWLNPKSNFCSHPGDILKTLEGAPVHVPLTIDLAAPQNEALIWARTPAQMLAQRLRRAGVKNHCIYAAEAGFFIVHRFAIPQFVNLAYEFWEQCDKEGLKLSVEPLLAFAGQMLTADPSRHQLHLHADLWSPRSRMNHDSPAPAIQETSAEP